MTFRACERIITSILIKAGVDSPGLCANMLLRHISGFSKLQLALASEREIPNEAMENLRILVARRCCREPMAYILGHREFYDHDFIVSSATLIPRPETELLVELALPKLEKSNGLLLDAGCGCGNIGLSLLAAKHSWSGILLDSSKAALKIARENAKKIAPCAILIQGDMEKLPCPDRSLDLIVSNPPYIGLDEKKDVMPDVLAFEPSSALFSGNAGYAHLIAIAREARRTLKPEGWLLMEHGATQQENLMNILASYQFQELSAHRDFAGLPRCVCARMPT